MRFSLRWKIDSRRGAGAALLAVALLVAAAPTQAQVASSLINEDDPLPAAGPGHIVSSINNTAVNHVGGYAASINSSDGATTLSHVWGEATGGPGAIIRTEGTFGPLVQTSFESFYGIDDAGSVSYSASGTGGPVGGFDSVWKDDTPVAVEGDPHPTLPGQFWRFGSRPGITAGGTPYFVGGITDVAGGTTQNRGLFFGIDGGSVLLLGGDALTDLPFPLGNASAISFDYRFSKDGTSYIGEVQMDTGSSTNDNAMVIDDAGLILGGTLVREANAIPVSVGGIGGEAWDNFDFTGITEGGQYFFTGDTDGDTATDEFIAKNGIIIFREGDVIGGMPVSGSIEGAYMNEDGDLAYIWDVAGNTLEALFLNDRLLLVEGEAVDFDGDGAIDPGAVVSSFTGISTLTLSDRDGAGQVNVYFTADVDTAGTSSTSDDLEGFYCMTVDPLPVAIELSGLKATPGLDRPSVTVEWTTSREVDHDGFNVYRSPRISQGYERINDGLVRGRSPYSFVDGNVRAATTYYYKIGAVDLRGAEIFYGPVEVTTSGWGIRPALMPNRPNPFTTRTEIQFSLSRDSRARLTVFDVAGRRVATLVDGELDAGDHSYWWNGLDSLDRTSATGVYFYRLETDDFSQTRKMIQVLRD